MKIKANKASGKGMVFNPNRSCSICIMFVKYVSPYTQQIKRIKGLESKDVEDKLGDMTLEEKRTKKMADAVI